jgi:hypothetical protein
MYHSIIFGPSYRKGSNRIFWKSTKVSVFCSDPQEAKKRLSQNLVSVILLTWNLVFEHSRENNMKNTKRIIWGFESPYFSYFCICVFLSCTWKTVCNVSWDISKVSSQQITCVILPLGPVPQH